MRLRNRSVYGPAGVLILLSLSLSAAHAQLIDSYNADSEALGTLASWTDQTGTQNATSASSGYGSPTVDHTLSAFNGHQYVVFGANTGLATAGALFTGNQARSIGAVYISPLGDTSGTIANDVNPIAGEGNAGGQNNLFILQSRNSGTINGAIGDPYLASYADDITSGGPPVANRLTFALATYDGAGNETLYWAYGLTGAVQSASLATGVLSTTGNVFSIGYDQFGEPSLGNMDIAEVQVFDAGLTSTQAAADISLLQAYYAAAVPEPSTYALLGAGMMAGLVFLRRRAQA